MAPIDVYQQRANECIEFANTSRDIGERTTWRELAICWLRLSEHAEEIRAHAKLVKEAPAASGMEIRR
jgi:hypothetical protein